MTIAEAKAAQRRLGRDARSAIPAGERAAAATALCANLWQLDAVRRARTILLYAAFGAEADLSGFAAQAARQGYALISGNARGADSVAQAACLEAGGWVISVVADSLEERCPGSHQLFLSEEDFDELFSVPRALHRNRVIHAMGAATFVAQCTFGRGGTWDGSVQNLHRQWTPLYCFRDGSKAAAELAQMGACLVGQEELSDFTRLPVGQLGFA